MFESYEGGAQVWLTVAFVLGQCAGRERPLCPGFSDFDLFSYRERVIDFDAEISDGAFDFGVAKQELHGP
jgi:hypothetical protein